MAYMGLNPGLKEAGKAVVKLPKIKGLEKP